MVRYHGTDSREDPSREASVALHGAAAPPPHPASLNVPLEDAQLLRPSVQIDPNSALGRALRVPPTALDGKLRSFASGGR